MPPELCQHRVSEPRTTGVEALEPAARDAAEATPSIENTRPRTAEKATHDDGSDVRHLTNRCRLEHTFAFERTSDRLDRRHASASPTTAEGRSGDTGVPGPKVPGGADRGPCPAESGGSTPVTVSAGERRLRAWRRLGLALDEVQLHLRLCPRRDRQWSRTSQSGLIKLGISKNHATRAWTLAGISDGDFDAYLSAARVDGALVTVGGALRHAAVASGTKNPDALVVPSSCGNHAYRRDLNTASRVAAGLGIGDMPAVLQRDDVCQGSVERTVVLDVNAARAAQAGKGVAQ